MYGQDIQEACLILQDLSCKTSARLCKVMQESGHFSCLSKISCKINEIPARLHEFCLQAFLCEPAGSYRIVLHGMGTYMYMYILCSCMHTLGLMHVQCTYTLFTYRCSMDVSQLVTDRIGVLWHLYTSTCIYRCVLCSCIYAHTWT